MLRPSSAATNGGAAERARPRVVVVGGGFGGLFAARALRRAPADVVLVDRHNHHLFQPLLYQVATASLSPSDIAQPIRWVLRNQANATVLLGEVRSVDLRGRWVVLDDPVVPREIPYDYLILATGSRHAYFGHEEWEPLAPGLKSLEDAREIRQRFLTAFELAEREPDPARRRPLLTFVIVGGGPTGVELAGAMSEIARHSMRRDFRTFDPREARILLLEGGERILASYPPELSEKALESLADLGVEVRTDAIVTDVDQRGVCVGDRRIEARNVFWAAGNAASPLSRTLGVPLDGVGRVVVERDLSIPGFPEAFALGDMALFAHQTGASLPGIAPVAMQQAKCAAVNVRRLIERVPTRPFHYTDKGNLATIGRASAVAEVWRLRVWGFPAWVMWLLIHIFFLIGFRNRILVLIQWAWAYVTYERGARLIVGEPSYGRKGEAGGPRSSHSGREPASAQPAGEPA